MVAIDELPEKEREFLTLCMQLSPRSLRAIKALAHALRDGTDPVEAMAPHIGRERSEEFWAVGREAFQ